MISSRAGERTLAAAVAVLLCAAAVWVWLQTGPAGKQNDPTAKTVLTAETANGTPPPGSPAAVPAQTTVTVLPIAETAAQLGAPDTAVADDLEVLHLLVQDFARQLGENPVGENQEIAAALTGKNPRAAAWLPRSGKFLNLSGEIIDRWGTPYFFHAESATRMKITSAGPDRILHTADDVTGE